MLEGKQLASRGLQSQHDGGDNGGSDATPRERDLDDDVVSRSACDQHPKSEEDASVGQPHELPPAAGPQSPSAAAVKEESVKPRVPSELLGDDYEMPDYVSKGTLNFLRQQLLQPRWSLA